MDEKRYIEERKSKKAVDDPKIRSGDPASWSCLSDEQRDTICEWYCDMELYNLEKKQKEENIVSDSSVLALIPFAVAYAHGAPGNFFLNVIAVWFIHFFVFYLFTEAYIYAFRLRTDALKSKAAKILSWIIFAIIGGFVSWVILNLIHSR